MDLRCELKEKLDELDELVDYFLPLSKYDDSLDKVLTDLLCKKNEFVSTLYEYRDRFNDNGSGGDLVNGR